MKGEERRDATEVHRPAATFEPEGNRTDQTAGRRSFHPSCSREPSTFLQDSYRYVPLRLTDSIPGLLSPGIINLVKLADRFPHPKKRREKIVIDFFDFGLQIKFLILITLSDFIEA